ncbi:kinase-like protein [Athelia psychrophila]|uniref:Kinase-like protein n=1 Tax=Athelia psychrophila TaxID=1759441 RepID=A0A166IID1_9AGAM|nr:kinase-like protein [Fibularhizoctonia sp. CBS 109695]
MQAAVHQMPPQMLSQYSRQPMNGVLNGHLTVPPTPPVVTRKRKRPHQYTVSYSEVQEVDSEGKHREVIVIDDTPPPPTISPSTTYNGFSASYQPPTYSAPIRTRARAAAEAQALSASSSSSALVAPAPKKRKREQVDEPRVTAAEKPTTGNQHPIAPTQSWASCSGPVTDDSKTPVPCDDKEGHYTIVPDDMIARCYRTVRLLGQGTFGKVVECVDTTNNSRVAIKIIRVVPTYWDASKIEVRVLQKVKERDPMNKHKHVHLLHRVDHRNHICLVSELLGMRAYDFLKENEFAPFPQHHRQSFARQLLGSIAFLHDLHLIHTDLKPENILLVPHQYVTVPVTIPGKVHRCHSTVVSTQHYRAPEIILGLGWSFPVEFYTGVALYQTHDNLEHLAMMEVVMGKMPERFARAGVRAKPEFFKEGCKLDWPKAKASRKSKKDVRATRSIHDRLLAFDPSQRISVKEALNHPYFSLSIPDES